MVFNSKKYSSEKLVKTHFNRAFNMDSHVMKSLKSKKIKISLRKASDSALKL